MHREDIAIFTTDLDYKIAQYMESGIVKGLSTKDLMSREEQLRMW